MGTIANKLDYLDGTKAAIRQAIVGKGISVSPDDPFRKYADHVKDIQSIPPRPEPFVIDPRWNWYDLKAILADDESEYQYRVIEMIYACAPTRSLPTSSGIVAIRTSDGAYYTSSATHTWDEAQDRQLYEADGAGGLIESVKARYIIKYYATEDITLSTYEECAYLVIDGAKVNGFGFGNSDDRYSKRALKYFELINGAGLRSTVTNASGMFQNCYSLKGVPWFDTSNITNMTNMFNGCYNLTSIPPFDTSKVTNMTSMFLWCHSLVSTPPLDVSNVTISPWFASAAIVSPRLKGLRASATFYSTDTTWTKILSRESMLYMIENRNMDVEGTITLTFGATNLARLTAEDKALAVEKRIILA